jgi:agmatinase
MVNLSKNFLNIPKEYTDINNSKYAVISVPFDKTSTWQKGADKGPKAIFEASSYLELYDIETDSLPYKNGVYTDTTKIDLATPERMVKSVEKTVSSYLEKNKFPIVLGGEHSISIGSAAAFAKKYKDITFLQLDAHSDLRDQYEGSRYNHACAMARIKENGPIVQVGIRSMDSSEKSNMDKKRVFFSHDIQDNNKWVKKVLKLLTKNVYITIDLDVFDPGIMPSTGTPEPGGLNWYQVMGLLNEVCKNKNLVGFDVNEMMPGYNKAPNFLAAKLIYKLISLHSYYIVNKK